MSTASKIAAAFAGLVLIALLTTGLRQDGACIRIAGAMPMGGNCEQPHPMRGGE